MGTIFLAYPHYGPVVYASALAACQASRQHTVVVCDTQDSRLPHSFNRLWCAALNSRKAQGWTHFAMLHSDVAPEPGWLDTLVAEQARVGVDVLSCVIPIKDERGLTSTAVRDATGTVRRLTLQEVWQLPETFTRQDLGAPGTLLVNSGCWVCDFTQPWVEQVCWRFVDTLVRDAEGTFHARTLSEDWDMAQQWAALGLRVAATRVVRLTHHGAQAYDNHTAWGTWTRDEEQG